MARQIIWTKRANNKFNKIIEYLEQEWGPGVTQKFVLKTYDIIELIADQSDLGTIESPDKTLEVFC